MPGNPTLPTENINEVILGLLSLEPNEIDELDYESYKSYLRELLVEITSGKRKIDSSETENIKNEFKRVRAKKGRFKIKKTKITASSLGLGKIRKQVKGTQQRMMLIPAKDDLKQPEVVSKGKGSDLDILNRISATLDSIIETLTNINKENKNRIEKQRKDAEAKRRGSKEKELESKPFEGITKVVSAIIKPFQSIWDRIVNFITNIILGRIVLKIIDWFAKEENQKKIQSLIRFFKDHWPTLLALYLRFGTGIGRFVGKLSSVLIKGSLRLIQITANLAARMGLKGAGKVGRFLGGRGGKLLSAGLAIGADVAMTAGAAGVVSGDIKVPGFSGGGWNKGFGNLFGGAKNFFGNMFNGLVKGPKGRDKVPAMLTDGEFVMSTGAVRKYGVDTLESMNASGGGTNVPQVANGTTFAEGGGLIGDIPIDFGYGQNPNDNTLRQAARIFSRQGKYGTEEDLFKTFKKIGGVADLTKMVGGENNFSKINQGHYGSDEALDAIRRSAIEKLKAVNNPQSFTQSSRASAGLTDLEKSLRLEEKISPRYAENLPKLNRPKPRITRIDPSRMLPAAGESSANAMRAAEKAARLVREPIPASRAIVPYRGGGLARTGVTGGLSEIPIQQIHTNMNIPGGAKRAALMKLLNNPATRMAGRASSVLNAPVIGDMILPEGTSEFDQRSSAYSDPRLSPYQRRRMMESVGLRGGAIKGGYGLKQQSFKDAPKTQIMRDDKGRPFVGYKALRKGKLTYIRGPQQAGAGTSNFWENLGRSINPGAYKDIDARNERKKYEEASKNSITSLRARGASQATIAKRQAELKKGVKPLPRPRSKPIGTGGGGLSKPRGGSKPTSATKPPSFSPTHKKGTATAQAALGVNKKK
jgi:hypothetical protein